MKGKHKGLIVVNTGDGKGKTTAAFGVLFRSLGRKMKCAVVQYVKGKLTKLLNPQEKLLIDGCHSEASAKNLASYLKSIDKDIYGIWGMQKHKHPELFIKQFKGIFKKIIAVKIPDDETNSCKPQQLKQIANRSDIKCSAS